MKCQNKYKTFKKKLSKNFQILNSCELFPYIGLKKYPNIVWTLFEPLITHAFVEPFDIGPPTRSFFIRKIFIRK